MPKLETKTKDIGEFKVRCTQFGAFEQAELGDRLTLFVAPFAGKLKDLKGFDVKSEVGELGPAIEAVLKNLSPSEVSSLRLDLVKNTEVQIQSDAKKIKWLALSDRDCINAAFGGNLKAFWQTVIFSAEVNFGPLFDGVRSAISVALASKQKEESPEEETSESTPAG